MTDDELRALVKRLEALSVCRHGIENHYCPNCDRLIDSKDLRQAVAALTALAAERDEALRRIARLPSILREEVEAVKRDLSIVQGDLVKQVTRNAFARAKEIAEAHADGRGWGHMLDADSYHAAAKRIAAAIEAEMHSDERQHSVDPLTELEPEVKHDPDA